MIKMTGQSFKNIKQKPADKVLPLLTKSRTIKVHYEKISIYSILLFQRITITKTFEDEFDIFIFYVIFGGFKAVPNSCKYSQLVSLHKLLSKQFTVTNI